MEFAYVYLHFSVLFFINAVVQAVIYFRVRRSFHKWAFLSLVLCAYVFLYRYGFYSGLLKDYPIFAGTILNIQLFAIAAPFMLVSIINPDFRISWCHTLMLLPAGLAQVRLIFLQMDPNFRESIILKSYEQNLPDLIPDNFVSFFYGIYMLMLFGYVITYFKQKLKWKNIWKNFKEGGVTYRISAYIFLTNLVHITVLTTTIPALDFIFPEKIKYYAGIVFPGETFFFFLSIQLLPFFISHQFTKFNFNEGSCQSFIKSRLDTINIFDLEQSFVRLLDVEEVYLDENLDLSSFSQKAGYHPRVISEYLNSIKKARFNDFINKYRLKRAIEILQSDPELNITHAALKAGFNSIPTFYRLFKKETGTSPEKYRVPVAAKPH
jgi:AraC-like DNA-binding protein